MQLLDIGIYNLQISKHLQLQNLSIYDYQISSSLAAFERGAFKAAICY